MPTDKPLALLGGLTAEAFLREHWQKKPLFIKQALPSIAGLISADELAGLALEDDVESRIIQEHAADQWSIAHGPFPETHFNTLPESHWTLIVQAVDHYLPEFSQLLSQFDFIPSWRLDDIMITYATDQGSVGPHFDYYDVFLIQLEGHRTWKVGQACDDSTPILPELPIKILQQFDTTDTWEVEPGDILYLPPGIAHHGVSNGECMTVSVGFRAPSNKDLLSAYTDFQLDTLDESERFADPDLSLQDNAGWISPKAVQQVKERILTSIDSPNALQTWFGQYISGSKYDTHSTEQDRDASVAHYSAADILDFYEHNTPLIRDESCRMVYAGDTPDQVLALFINGEQTPFPPGSEKLVTNCCHYRVLLPEHLAPHLDSKHSLEFLSMLLNTGLFYPET